MIVRIVANAVGVVLLAAVVGAVIDPAIVRTAVEHITAGLVELVDIGERLGGSAFGQQIADHIRQFFSKATQ